MDGFAFAIVMFFQVFYSSGNVTANTQGFEDLRGCKQAVQSYSAGTLARDSAAKINWSCRPSKGVPGLGTVLDEGSVN